MFPRLTRRQVREVDRVAIEEYGVPGVVLMENAGRNAARAVHRECAERNLTGQVVIFCGKGNNAGDGFVIARHLTNIGHKVIIGMTARPDQLAGDAAINYHICERMALQIENAATIQLKENDIIVDALLGTGFNGDVRDPLAGVINQINSVPRSLIVAIDVPSGLDCDTGQPAKPCIRAGLTVTFVAEKVGFAIPPAPDYTGRILVADIGAPRIAIERVHAIG